MVSRTEYLRQTCNYDTGPSQNRVKITSIVIIVLEEMEAWLTSVEGVSEVHLFPYHTLIISPNLPPPSSSPMQFAYPHFSTSHQDPHTMPHQTP